MDFSKDDELDYEEDDLESDSLKDDLESKNSVRDEMNKNSKFSEFDDQYLQINCPEEEENFIEKAHTDIANSQIQNAKKVEESEKPSSSPKEQAVNSNENIKTNNNKKTNKNFKKKERQFQHRVGMKKQITNSFSFSQWFPKWNVSDVVNIVNSPALSMYSHQMLNFNQDFYSNSISPFPLLKKNVSSLMLDGPRFGQSQAFNSVSPVGMGLSYSLVQQRNKLFDNKLPGPSFDKNRSNFQFENDRRTFSRRLGFENIKPKVIKRHESSNIKGKKNFKHRAFYDQNAHYIGAENFSNCGTKNHGGGSECSFSKLDCNLKDEEREVMKLKKEARLKRFMNDEIVTKEKNLNNSTCEKEIPNSLHLGAEYFQKMEEQKLTREKLLSLKGQKEKRKNSDFDTNLDTSVGKPDINKELLLKKRNPFDADLEISSSVLMTKIKQENERHDEVKQEISDNKFAAPMNEPFVKREENTILMNSNTSGQSSGVVKSTAVKFVRTVSKSFDELALRKPKVEVSESNDETPSPSSIKTLPFIAASKMSFLNNDFSTQVESQLTGCIVKVFNIPPSTTTNDILTLCSPIGIVKEIKINLPKENSVAIRFAKPSYAENFFSVYHGQKMNNYFLNVIVV